MPLTKDEEIAKKIINEIIEFGHPVDDNPHVLDWLVWMDILQPPDSEPKWSLGSEYKKFVSFLERNSK